LNLLNLLSCHTIFPVAATTLYHAHGASLVFTNSATMKSMQRRFGAFQKRSDDQADVGQVLADFKAADDMIERVRWAFSCSIPSTTLTRYSSSKTSKHGKKDGRIF
jgi:hypothetical protein